MTSEPSTSGAAERRRKRLLILVTEYYYFDSHKQDLVSAAVQEGLRVYVAARRGNATVTSNGVFTFIDLDWKRSGSQFGTALRFFPELLRVYRLVGAVQPDILHNIAWKPAVMGSIAAFGRKIAVANSINGLGFIFFAKSAFARTVQIFCGAVLKLSVRLNDARVVLQNRDDAAYLSEHMKIAAPHQRLIKGSGVDPDFFAVQPEPSGEVFKFLVLSRLLHMKGIHVAVAAHQILRQRGVASELVICGGDDPGNPSSIPEATLSQWRAIPGISFLGHVKDVRPAIAECHVVMHVALAGEGLPKALLEAAACGRAMIASDVAGNREVVVAGETGLLVPSNDPTALAEAMQRMMERADDRQRWAAAARTKVLQEFSTAIITERHRQLYRELAAS